MMMEPGNLSRAWGNQEPVVHPRISQCPGRGTWPLARASASCSPWGPGEVTPLLWASVSLSVQGSLSLRQRKEGGRKGGEGQHSGPGPRSSPGISTVACLVLRAEGRWAWLCFPSGPARLGWVGLGWVPLQVSLWEEGRRGVGVQGRGCQEKQQKHLFLHLPGG